MTDKVIIVDKGDLAWVLASKNRRAAMKELASGFETPSTLAEKTGTSMPMASKTLRDFAVRGIVSCANPDDVKGRLYELTRKGKNLLKNM